MGCLLLKIIIILVFIFFKNQIRKNKNMKIFSALALLASVLGAPVAQTHSTSINVSTTAGGPGSISVTVNGEEWSYEWEELTDDVKGLVEAKLTELGIEGGFNADGFTIANNFPSLTENSNDGSTTTNEYNSVINVKPGQNFSEIIAAEKAKMLAWVQEYANAFYDQVKAHLEAN